MFLRQIFCICNRNIIAGLLTNKWQRMYLSGSLCTLCLLACQAIVTIGYLGLLLCLRDIFLARSVYAVMSKNTEPNEWLKFARVWLCFIFILALNLSLFSFWQSTVSVFILALDCLCFHSGTRLSLITCLQTSFPGLPQVPDVTGWGTDFADGWTDCGWPEPAGGQRSAVVAGWMPGHHSPSSAGQRTSGAWGILFHEHEALLHEGKKIHFLLLLCQIKTQNGKNI